MDHTQLRRDRAEQPARLRGLPADHHGLLEPPLPHLPCARAEHDAGVRLGTAAILRLFVFDFRSLFVVFLYMRTTYQVPPATSYY